MNIFKQKLFLPVTAAALLTGYGFSEWVVPRYFNPAESQKVLSSQSNQKLWIGDRQYLGQFLSKNSPSGNYLAGQFARRQKDWLNANDYMDQVLQKNTDDLNLKKNMMVLTMEAGYSNRAISLAKEVFNTEPDNMLATLFLTVDHLSNENYIAATETLDQISAHNPASFIVPVLKLWISVAQGNLTFDGMQSNSFYMYHLLLAGHYLNMQSEVVTYVEEHIKNIELDFRDVEKLADLLTITGGHNIAKDLYNSLSGHSFLAPTIEKKLNYLEETEKQEVTDLIKIPIVNNPKEGTAKVFLDMATVMFREGSKDSATIFAQMALYLDSEFAEAQLIVADVLGNHQQYDAAARYLKNIPEESLLYRQAQKTLADLYLDQDKTDQAIQILENLYKEKDDIDSLVQVGNVYRYKENFNKAIKIYSTIINQLKTSENETIADYWHILYARGMAYERLKKFDRSEQDLEAALEFRPDHPYLLNYLGYSWVDQGRNLNRSLKMLKKAAALQPDDGYIIDSLGWAYYKMNDMNQAIIYLEDAVELLPYDATINDHLGDAYWQDGRKLEAQFQWQRAFNYSEENEIELRESIQEKLQNGLNTIDVISTTDTQSSDNAAQAL